MFDVVLVQFRIYASSQHSMEVAVEAVVTEFDVELFNDVLDDEQFAVFDRLLEGSLNVPKHQVLQLLILGEDLLEAFKVALSHAVD